MERFDFLKNKYDKHLLVDLGRIELLHDDIFNTLKRTGVTDLPQFNAFVTRTFDFSQRTFQITFSTPFGNRQVKALRKRSGGVSEEQRRVN